MVYPFKRLTTKFKERINRKILNVEKSDSSVGSNSTVDTSETKSKSLRTDDAVLNLDELEELEESGKIASKQSEDYKKYISEHEYSSKEGRIKEIADNFLKDLTPADESKPEKKVRFEERVRVKYIKCQNSSPIKKRPDTPVRGVTRDFHADLEMARKKAEEYKPKKRPAQSNDNNVTKPTKRAKLSGEKPIGDNNLINYCFDQASLDPNFNNLEKVISLGRNRKFSNSEANKNYRLILELIHTELDYSTKSSYAKSKINNLTFQSFIEHGYNFTKIENGEIKELQPSNKADKLYIKNSISEASGYITQKKNKASSNQLEEQATWASRQVEGKEESKQQGKSA